MTSKNKYVVLEWLIKILGYALVLITVSIIFKNTIYIDALASTNYPNAIKKECFLRYEFKIRDINSSKYLEENDLVGTYTTKYLELKVLNSLIEEV